MRHRIVLIIVPTFLACSSFEAAPTPPDGGQTGDGSSTTTATSDSGSGDGDAGGGGGPCTGPTTVNVVGASDTGGTYIDDIVPTKSLDAYRYTYTGGGASVQCANIWLSSIDAKTTAVRVGVYADDSDLPAKLLATTTITSPITGWNRLRLSAPIVLSSGTAIWIAVNPLGEDIKVRSRSTGCIAQNTSRAMLVDTKLPLPDRFTTNQAFQLCNAALYLSPD